MEIWEIFTRSREVGDKDVFRESPAESGELAAGAMTSSRKS